MVVNLISGLLFTTMTMHARTVVNDTSKNISPLQIEVSAKERVDISVVIPGAQYKDFLRLVRVRGNTFRIIQNANVLMEKSFFNGVSRLVLSKKEISFLKKLAKQVSKPELNAIWKKRKKTKHNAYQTRLFVNGQAVPYWSQVGQSLARYIAKVMQKKGRIYDGGFKVQRLYKQNSFVTLQKFERNQSVSFNKNYISDFKQCYTPLSIGRLRCQTPYGAIYH